MSYTKSQTFGSLLVFREQVCAIISNTGLSSRQMRVIRMIQATENLSSLLLGLFSHLCDSVKLWADFGELLFAVLQSRLQLLILSQCVLIQLIKWNKQGSSSSFSISTESCFPVAGQQKIANGLHWINTLAFRYMYYCILIWLDLYCIYIYIYIYIYVHCSLVSGDSIWGRVSDVMNTQ